MNFVRRITVLPDIPDPLRRLDELAYNLWWSWETEAQSLFARIDPDLWEATNHNPVKLLKRVAQSALNSAATDPSYMDAYHAVLADFDAYMAADASTWFAQHHAEKADQTIAYFSAEFGLHEALPIYSGGLGVLSGDHCKAASDLGLPFVGVGFLYPQGYFTQRIDRNGMQQADYEKVDFSEVPARPASGADGAEVMIHVDLPGRTVYAKVWKIQVGRIPIYLMDTDVERNAPQDRELSARLYAGDREMRISQEVVLGIGGVRAVRALGITPAVWHMNEGHSAFMGLERIRELVQQQGLDFTEAVEAVRASAVFTTHTPVPAGNDTFAFELVEKFFWQYWGQLGINRDRFIAFARQDLEWGAMYSMTVLALRLSGHANGVSKLHGQVSRAMWQFLWPDTPRSRTPIGHVTNGVHTKTWLSQSLKELYSRTLPASWQEEVDDAATWSAVEEIPDHALWETHQQNKVRMVEFVRARTERQLRRHGEGPAEIEAVSTLLDPNALTLGFARRFATYKRATLIFRDEERLKRLLHDPERPMQIVFSGKAHPADEPGKALIQHIFHLSRRPDFAGKIVFVENYDMNIARHLIAGVDVWLNTPRRPHEASGTSGQKAAASGVPNLSVLDGWWVEGYNGENGWAIGEAREFKDEETQDEADARHLYALLENEIVPRYYSRNAEGVPQGWIQVMKESIRSCAPQFSMRRMVKEYVTELYLPAASTGRSLKENEYQVARGLAHWKRQIRQRWHEVGIEVDASGADLLQLGDVIDVAARVWLHGIPTSDVAVEIVAVDSAQSSAEKTLLRAPMRASGGHDGATNYTGTFQPPSSGQFQIGVRVLPRHESMVNAEEMGLVKWA